MDVFFLATAMAPHHPYVSTCGIDEKLSKMAGNDQLATEIPLVTVQWWKNACKQLHAFLIETYVYFIE